MGRVINVNWGNLNGIGNDFLEQANEMNDLTIELKETFDLIDNAWRGYDANAYKYKVPKALRMLDKETKYLASWHSFLTKTSNKYVSNVENGVTNINKINNMYEDKQQNS